MIRIISEYLAKDDLAMLRRFAKWVLSTMVRPSLLRKSYICIRIMRSEDHAEGQGISDLKEYGAWVHYRGVVNGRKKFDMVLNARRLNRRAKNPIVRLKGLMLDMAHELVHVKQYLKNELFDYVDGKAKYKGEIFLIGRSDNDAVYYNSPWEIEAYGREQGLYKMFKTMLKNEAKKNK